jgi:hypothetical protein
VTAHMRRRTLVAFAPLAVILAAAGCDRGPTKAEILKKAEGSATKADLEKALGQPANVDKVGPLETWTYNAADGTVTFTLLAGRVTLSATGDKKK